jgi:hypothetical protein
MIHWSAEFDTQNGHIGRIEQRLIPAEADELRKQKLQTPPCKL